MQTWLCFLILSAVAQAQAPSTGDPAFATVPFDRWIAAGDHAQIPWKVQVAAPVLGFGLRLYLEIKVTVQGKEVARRPQGELILLVQFTDSQGRVYRDHGTLDLAELQKSGPKQEFALSVGSLVAPGDYRIAVAIFDTAANEYSFASKTMQIRPPSGDVLPGIWRAVPAVETLPAEEAPEAGYYPTLKGRLYLPLETRLPVHVEVVLNLPSPDLPKLLYDKLMGAFVEQFKAVSHLDVRNGSLDMALFDLDRGRVGFEQTQVRELDWSALRTALMDAGPAAAPRGDPAGSAHRLSTTDRYSRPDRIECANLLPSLSGAGTIRRGSPGGQIDHPGGWRQKRGGPGPEA
jgi:hypothetical protein